MSKIVYLKGVPTPRYRAQRIRQDLDPDLFVKMLNNHPEHIERAKTKRANYLATKKQEAAAAAARLAEREKLLAIFGNLAVWTCVALLVVMCL